MDRTIFGPIIGVFIAAFLVTYIIVSAIKGGHDEFVTECINDGGQVIEYANDNSLGCILP